MRQSAFARGRQDRILIAKTIKGEAKDFKVQRTKTLTVAGTEPEHLIGMGAEADDGDPASVEVVVFAVGKTVVAACVHGEGNTAPRWRPAMLKVLTSVKHHRTGDSRMGFGREQLV